MNVEERKDRTIPERGYMVGMTRHGRPKVTLYKLGRKILEQPMATHSAAVALGRAWSAS